MDFARKQLLKYGWTDGKGLGKNENGIQEALKPELKFDTTGVGHDQSEQFTFNWWENVYNHAADNIQVQTTENGTVNVKLNSEESVDITTRKYSHTHLKKKNMNLEYGSFLKTSKLTAEGVMEHEDKESYSTNDLTENIKTANLTDEELFAACGGRTAHKGARHGLTLNGKLARIEEQEMLLLKKIKKEANNLHIDENKSDNKYSISENQMFQSQETSKKQKKKKESIKTDTDTDVVEDKKRKKSKKRKRSQSENDDFIDEETALKRAEYFCERQSRTKIKNLKRREKKKISKMADMLENVCVLNGQQDNKDDGFVESTKSNSCDDEKSKKKHKKKKRKLNNEVAKSSEDDGFEECINEVNEKLIYYKELRKDLQKEKRKGDEKRITKMAEDFERKL